MFKKLLYASLAALTLSCIPLKKPVCMEPHMSKNESIQYVCYPKDHFSVVSYQDNGKTIRVDNWGKNKRLGCFGGYSISNKNKDEGDITVLFNDKDCDNVPEDVIYGSTKELTNPNATFKRIVEDLRYRNRTKLKMNQCLK